LPEDLVIIAEHEPESRPIEGKGLCLLVSSEGGFNGSEVLDQLKDHLLNEKGWIVHELSSDPEVEVRMLHSENTGERALAMDIAGDYPEEVANLGDCWPLEDAILGNPDAVLVSVYMWR
jgi:hypothetical protein